jgi:HSP90 family molecular chaperone
MHYPLLQRDDKGFAHPERIQKLVKNYSQFVSFPIYTWQEKGFTKEVSYILALCGCLSRTLLAEDIY